MKKYAVIDVGSNSVRLMLLANGKVLYKTLSTTRLGEGLAQTSALRENAIARTATAVQTFYTQAVAEGAHKVYAYATAAVRSAQNGRAFVERVKDLCGLCIDVIDGKTEAEIGIVGALGNADGGVIDVGGASTELAVRHEKTVIYRESADVGVVRLYDICGRDTDKLKAFAKDKVGFFHTAPRLGEVYAIGGTATTLCAYVLGLTTYNPERVTGTKLSLSSMREAVARLSALSVAETAELPCMPKGRAEVILGGAVWLTALMEYLHLDSITVSDRDNLEGYAVKKGLL